MTAHPTVMERIGIALVAVCSLQPGFAQDSAEDFAVTLESLVVEIPLAEFSAIRITQDLPTGVLDALTRGLPPMAEWGEPHYAGDDLLVDAPNSRHIISWKTASIVVVVFIRQKTTLVFLGDLEQRRGCEYSLGTGVPATITLVDLKQMLRPDFVGQLQLSCRSVVRF